MVKKKIIPAKTLTELPDFKEFFGEFESEYKPFVSWYLDIDNPNQKSIEIEFISNKPDEYTNKWDKTQWKIEVIQDQEECILSGGKRLFKTILGYCKKENKLPIDLGKCQLLRIGSGFDTRYKLSIL